MSDKAAIVTMEDGKVLLNGHIVAIVKGGEVTPDQIHIGRKVETPREHLMANLNARLKATR